MPSYADSVTSLNRVVNVAEDAVKEVEDWVAAKRRPFEYHV